MGSVNVKEKGRSIINSPHFLYFGSTVLFFILLLGGVVKQTKAENSVTETNLPFVRHEIRYHMPEAGEVWLVWGINEWQTLPEEIRPVGTVIINNVMHTPMSAQTDYFTVHIQFPEDATVEYGFMITKARDGAEIPGTWEGMGRLLPKPSENVTEIHSKRSLSRGTIFDFVSDLKFRRKAMLQLALSFLLFFGIAAIVTSPAPPFAHKLAHRIDLDAVELAVAFIVFKLVLIGMGYLAVGAFDDSNREIVTFQLAYWQELKSAFAVGDVQWYLSITNEGYENRPFSADTWANWAFYPLWPLAMRLGQYLPISTLTWGILLANALSIVAIVALYRLALLDFDRSIARLTAVFAMTFPGAYFLMRPGPESLFFLLTILCLYAGRKKQWLWASVFGALAILTRLQGALLLFPLLYLYYRHYKETREHAVTAVSFLLIPAALLLFMTHLYFLTGNFFANLHIQSAWDNHLSYPFAAMVRFLSNPVVVDYYGWNLTPVSFIFLFAATILAIIAATRKEFPKELLIYMALSLYIVAARDNLNASLRYMLPIFPIFLALALLFHKRQNLVISILFLFIIMQAFYFIAFAKGIHWAIT